MGTHGTQGGQDRVRIEKLEALLERTGGGGGGGGSSTIVTVANYAALVALADATADLVFVQSTRSIWSAAPTSTLAPVADEIIARVAGGNWLRTEYSDPLWRTGVNDIYIDPANGAANDENTGFTPGAPLRTGRELFRRWGWGHRVQIACDLATSPDGFTNIHVVSSLGSAGSTVPTDTLPMNVALATNCNLRILTGPALVRRTATLTGVTAMDPAAPLGGTRLRLTDATLPSWAAYAAVNTRGRITSGAAVGGTFQVQDAVAANQADCSACQTTNEAAFSSSTTTVTPGIGDGYVIESLVTVTLDTFFHVAQEDSPGYAPSGGSSFCNIVGAFIPATQQNFTPSIENGVFLNFYQCTIDRGFILTGSGDTNFIACYFTAGFSAAHGGVVLGGGGALALPGASTFFLIRGPNDAGNNVHVVDENFVAQGFTITLVGEQTVVRAFASWRSPVGTSGVRVGSDAFGRARVQFRGRVWGNQNARCGIAVGAGCVAVGPAQNITGTQGDFKLAGAAPVGGDSGSRFDATTRTYLPLAAGPSDMTWALLTPAQPAGYGGNCHYPLGDSHWLSTEVA